MPRDFYRDGRIVDIGAGSGTYSKLYRQLLSKHDVEWNAVEIWKPYIDEFKLHELYDEVFVTSAKDHFESINWYYDICFLGDVIEHMTKEEALKVVDLAMERCSLVIISVPIIHYPQDEYNGNPYEKHVKDDWSHKEAMESFPNIVFHGVENEIGVYFCSRDERVKKHLTPRIGAYAICKDEIQFVDRFYESIKQADYISICDTGSTDGTYERLLKLAGDFVNVSVTRIHVSPWRFDDARNVALSKLPSELDLCVSIDMDELLEDGWKKKLDAAALADLNNEGRVKDRYNHRFETVWNWDKPGEDPVKSSHWHERIHARKGYRWKLPVHEILVKHGGNERVGWLYDLTMTQKPDTTKSRSSYLPLLEQSLRENPNVWKSWSFYGGELQTAGRYADAIEAYRKGMDVEGADQTFLMMQVARAHQASGDIEAAIEAMTAAAFKSKASREIAVYVAELHELNKQYHEATMWIKKAEGLTTRSTGYTYDPSCWDDSFDRRRGRIASKYFT